jgi:hypothetical protein
MWERQFTRKFFSPLKSVDKFLRAIYVLWYLRGMEREPFFGPWRNILAFGLFIGSLVLWRLLPSILG